VQRYGMNTLIVSRGPLKHILMHCASCFRALRNNRNTNIRIVREEELLIVEITALTAKGVYIERVNQ
jgi:hypothetical protein